MVDRGKVIKDLKDYRDRDIIREGITVFDNDPRYRKMLINNVLALLEEQKIVRCADCKWYDERISMCDNCGLPREQTFFCADGERKDCTPLHQET